MKKKKKERPRAENAVNAEKKEILKQQHCRDRPLCLSKIKKPLTKAPRHREKKK